MSDFKVLDEMLNFSLDKNPYYKNFPINEYKYDAVPGSMPADNVFAELIDKINPGLIIEIGSYKRYSAICMANNIKKKNIDFRIICIDTWLDMFPVDFKYIKNGYPTIYYQFVYNIIHDNLQNNIIPLPAPSRKAFGILKNKVEADMVYIDGSHEDIDVYYDCKNYWSLIKVGGLMFGDDWTWEGVRSGVITFAEENKLHVQLHQNQVHWIIQK